MSLDELPQLINVLRGEMSLVGPRPAIPYELQYYKDWHHQRNTVQPGITGLWQVYGRSIVGFDESMTLDVRYVNELSFWLDVKLILLTIPTMLMQRGAR
jgi:lipopolysaccharide/colanic/teichoic acid biosynthesis glycosyltransferase